MEETEWQTSWPMLSSKIAIAIHNLNTAANLSKKVQFNQLTMAIVDVVRTTLYCSNTIDKEAAPLKDDVNLRSTHRSLVASLAKLVISASVASSDSSPDGVAKLQADSNELLAAVRNFVETCQELSIPLQLTHPTIGYDKESNYRHYGRRNSSGHTLRSSIVSSLNTQRHAIAKISSALQSLINNMHSQVSEQSGQSIVTQFRQYTNQVSQFLNVIEATQASTRYPQHPRLQAIKQSLYDNLGSIFITVQAMTDPSLSSIEADDHISLWLQRVDTHMNVACEIMQNMVNEYGESHDMDPSMPPNLDRQHSGDATANSRPLSLSILNDSSFTSDASDVNKMAMDQDSDDESVDSFISALQTVSNGPGGLDMDNRPLQPFTMDDFEHNADIAQLDDGILLSKKSLESINQPDFKGRAPLARRPVSDMLPAGDPTSDQRNFTMRRSVTSPELETTQPSAKQDKLKKFFGEDAAVAVEAASSKSAVNDTPSFLGYDYDPADIVVNMEGDVKGGTLSALTERLTSHQFLGKQWHYFCLPNQILIY
jgi:son of sevenless-like protein